MYRFTDFPMNGATLRFDHGLFAPIFASVTLYGGISATSGAIVDSRIDSMADSPFG